MWIRNVLRASLAVAVSCVVATAYAAGPGTEMQTIKVGVQPVMISSLWNAEAQGIFKKNGLNVELVRFASGAAQTAALKSGVVNVGWGAATTFYVTRSSGVDVDWVATLADFNRNDAFVAGPKSGIKSVKDLKGKTIAIPFNTVTHAPFLAWLAANGISEKDVKLVNLAPPQATAALLSGDADAMAAWPPFTTQVVDAGGRLIGNPKDAPDGGWSWVGFAADSQWAASHPEILEKFLRSLDEGAKDLQAHHDEIVNTAIKITGMPRTTAEATFKLAVFDPLKDNLIPGKPQSMCNADEGKGIGRILNEARDFYQQRKVFTHGVPNSQYLNPKYLSAALGISCP